MDDFKDLNCVFLELFGKLYENGELLSTDVYKYMQNVLFSQYKTESEKIVLKKLIQDKKELFELRSELSTIPPRGWWIFKNRAKRLYIEKLEKQFEKYFDEFKKSFDTVN